MNFLFGINQNYFFLRCCLQICGLNSVSTRKHTDITTTISTTDSETLVKHSCSALLALINNEFLK